MKSAVLNFELYTLHLVLFSVNFLCDQELISPLMLWRQLFALLVTKSPCHLSRPKPLIKNSSLQMMYPKSPAVVAFSFLQNSPTIALVVPLIMAN